MNDRPPGTLTVFSHAARTLTAVTVDSYNEELREIDGFVGDRASGHAFRKLLDECRARLIAYGHDDPLGTRQSCKGSRVGARTRWRPVSSTLLSKSSPRNSLQ